jgi:hypothetical protein
VIAVPAARSLPLINRCCYLFLSTPALLPLPACRDSQLVCTDFAPFPHPPARHLSDHLGTQILLLFVTLSGSTTYLYISRLQQEQIYAEMAAKIHTEASMMGCGALSVLCGVAAAT